MPLYASAGLTSKVEGFLKTDIIYASAVVAKDETEAEVTCLKQLREMYPKKNGYKDHMINLRVIPENFILLSKGIINKDWEKKVEWAKVELTKHLLDGKFDQTVNYVLAVIAEDRYNAGRKDSEGA